MKVWSLDFKSSPYAKMLTWAAGEEQDNLLELRAVGMRKWMLCYNVEMTKNSDFSLYTNIHENEGGSGLFCLLACFTSFMSTWSVILHSPMDSSLIEEHRKMARAQRGVTQWFKMKESNGKLTSKKRLGWWGHLFQQCGDERDTPADSDYVNLINSKERWWLPQVKRVLSIEEEQSKGKSSNQVNKTIF